jgi:hypothetical protein
MLFLLFLSASACVTTCGKEHTAFFLANWHNNPDLFFVHLPYDDRCQEISNANLRKEFPSEVAGRDIEHIIETANDLPEYAQCKRNIRGNLVAADSTWNKQVGNLCCAYTDAEKRIVYGPKRYTAAQSAVIECCTDPSMNFLFALVCMAIVSITIICMLVQHGMNVTCGANAEANRSTYDQEEDASRL